MPAVDTYEYIFILKFYTCGFKIMVGLLFLSRPTTPCPIIRAFSPSPRLSLIDERTKETRENRRAFRFPAQKSVSPLEARLRVGFFYEFVAHKAREARTSRVVVRESADKISGQRHV